MTSDGTFNYQHDADGNQTVRTRISNSYATDYRTTYSWDYRNRLTDIEYFDNNNVLTKHVHFVYGVFDHLIATEVDTTGGGSYNQIQHYVLDVSPEAPQAGVPGTALAQPLLVFGPNANLTERVLEATDRIFAEGSISSPTVADTVDWDLVDNVGSFRYELDNTGNIIDRVIYSSFGQVSYESNPSIAHFTGFAGGHVDSTSGLVNDDHRWYDSATGKWLNDDPEGFAAGDDDLTRYVGNSPSDRSDPLGLKWKWPPKWWPWGPKKVPPPDYLPKKTPHHGPAQQKPNYPQNPGSHQPPPETPELPPAGGIPNEPAGLSHIEDIPALPYITVDVANSAHEATTEVTTHGILIDIRHGAGKTTVKGILTWPASGLGGGF